MAPGQRISAARIKSSSSLGVIFTDTVTERLRVTVKTFHPFGLGSRFLCATEVSLSYIGYTVTLKGDGHHHGRAKVTVTSTHLERLGELDAPCFGPGDSAVPRR